MADAEQIEEAAEESAGQSMGEGNGYDRRLSSLERWRESVDNERGQIMGELGGIGATLTAIREEAAAARAEAAAARAAVSERLGKIEDKLEERPSRAEFVATEKQIESIRAKAKGLKFSELEVTGPGNMKFKLLGVSGVTIVVVFFLLILGFALWLLRK